VDQPGGHGDAARPAPARGDRRRGGVARDGCCVKGLGAEEVTVLVRGDRVLEQVEAFAGELVVEGLRGAGVDVRFRTTAQRVERTGDGPVRLHLDDGSTLEADELLVATGRRPRTDDLGLETVGLEPGRSLPTDDGQAVHGVDGGWLFAAGDVTGRVLLTHQGKYQARLLGDRLAAEARGEAPDLAAWGRHAPTADDAPCRRSSSPTRRWRPSGSPSGRPAERGLRTRLVSYDLGSVAGAALAADGYRGRAALLVDLDREVVLGATFVGQDVAELLHSATIAVVGEVPLSRLWHAVPAFPT
jgi:dihydrolipoamide dehydrogenase